MPDSPNPKAHTTSDFFGGHIACGSGDSESAVAILNHHLPHLADIVGRAQVRCGDRGEGSDVGANVRQ